MSSKYEIIDIDNKGISVDVSKLRKTEDMFFNATDIAKQFDKRPNDFLNLDQTKEYINLLLSSLNTISNGNTKATYDDLVFTKRGNKYGGTWLHTKLALRFARWLSVKFEFELDRWIEQRIERERIWKREREKLRTGFRPMTDAIKETIDDPKFYHYSNEADMLNIIVTGKKAKQFKQDNNVDDVRDALCVADAKLFDKMQIINTGLIRIGMPYEERKEKLTDYYNKEQELLDY